MSDSHKVSRRDWFRLSPRRPETDTPADITASEAPRQPLSATQHSMGKSPHGLQPIEHPENHDNMNLSELPPMREALLTAEQVRQLFADIEALASDILLMQRSARSPRATPSKAITAEQLRIALETFLSGTVPRVQIRYHWQAANWIDTLERRDAGVRLIRITHDPAAFASRPANNSQ